jgi:hypothetical protein
MYVWRRVLRHSRGRYFWSAGTYFLFVFSGCKDTTFFVINEHFRFFLLCRFSGGASFANTASAPCLQTCFCKERLPENLLRNLLSFYFSFFIPERAVDDF